MITALLQEARVWPVAWQRRLAIYRLRGTKDTLAFFAMAGLPVLAVAAIVYFAYANRTQVEPVRIEAARREAALAHRRATDLKCLAENIYFEARGEPLEGQYAVAEVTMNRARSKYFPDTICGVVHEARWDPIRKRPVAHFSWTELGPLSPQDGVAWKQAMAVATGVYDDLYRPIVPGALFYHATSIRPEWAKTQKAVATIGNHIFYR
jgi:spore germination cell wall hydrolase CwlJ-like protein